MVETDLLTLSFGDHRVTYNGEIYPTGAICCSMLNVSETTLEQLRPSCDALGKFFKLIPSGKVNQAAVNTARSHALRLMRMLACIEPFRFLQKIDLVKKLEGIYSVESWSQYAAYSRVANDPSKAEELRTKYAPVREMLLLSQHLSKLTDSVSDLQRGLQPFLNSVESDQISRTSAGYASAFQTHFPKEITFRTNDDSWLVLTNLTQQYESVTLPGREQPVLMTRLNFVSLFGLFRTDFFEGIRVGHAPKKCAVCGRWFLTTDGHRMKYCDDVNPDDPSGRTCRAIGNYQSRENREPASENPLKVIYSKTDSNIRQRVSRGLLPSDKAAAMKKLAKDKMQRAMFDPSYANGTYKDEMDWHALEKEADALLLMEDT